MKYFGNGNGNVCPSYGTAHPENQTDEDIQVWYADDASSGAKLEGVRHWWDLLETCGPQFSYFPKEFLRKSWLLVKLEFQERVAKVFKDTNVNITTDGCVYLGAAIGNDKTFQQNKVTEWKEQLVQLTNIAETQPHAAYCTLIHGLKGKWMYTTTTTRY